MSWGTSAAGEVVMVEYGRRNAIGVVFGPGAADPAREIKPIAARVRSDGPVLPPLSVELARHITTHYLAPPALVVRAMLAPGMLERVERSIAARHGRHAQSGVAHPATRGAGEARAPRADHGCRSRGARRRQRRPTRRETARLARGAACQPVMPRSPRPSCRRVTEPRPSGASPPAAYVDSEVGQGRAPAARGPARSVAGNHPERRGSDA